MRPLRILCVSSLYSPLKLGGAEMVAESINNALTDRGHDVSVLTLSPDEDRLIYDKDQRVYQMRLRNLYWPFGTVDKPRWRRLVWHLIDLYNPRMGRRVKALLGELKPDLMITHNIDGFSPAVWRAASACGIPVIHIAHDLGLLCPSRTMFRDGAPCSKPCGMCRVMTGTIRMGLSQTTALVSVSEALDRVFSHFGASDRAPSRHVIVNPLDEPTTRCQVQEERWPDRQEKAGPLRLGMIGRVEDVKGTELLLEALDRLGTDRPGLVIAGRADDRYRKLLIRRFPWAESSFAGYVHSDLVLAQIDVLVVPSLLFEGLGMGPLEARRQGVPSLVANTGGLPEVIEPDTTGWLFKTGSAQDLADKIAMLQANPALLQTAKAACAADDWQITNRKKLDQYELLLDQCVRAAT